MYQMPDYSTNPVAQSNRFYTPTVLYIFSGLPMLNFDESRCWAYMHGIPLMTSIRATSSHFRTWWVMTCESFLLDLIVVVSGWEDLKGIYKWNTSWTMTGCVHMFVCVYICLCVSHVLSCPLIIMCSQAARAVTLRPAHVVDSLLSS